MKYVEKHILTWYWHVLTIFFVVWQVCCSHHRQSKGQQTDQQVWSDSDPHDAPAFSSKETNACVGHGRSPFSVWNLESWVEIQAENHSSSKLGALFNRSRCAFLSFDRSKARNGKIWQNHTVCVTTRNLADRPFSKRLSCCQCAHCHQRHGRKWSLSASLWFSDIVPTSKAMQSIFAWKDLETPGQLWPSSSFQIIDQQPLPQDLWVNESMWLSTINTYQYL